MNSLQQYYNGWPHTGQYYNTLNKIYYLLYNYLINFPITGKKYTVIFDIDDTLVFTDPLNIIPNNRNVSNEYMLFPKIPQMVEIIKLCNQLGFKIIILTARPYSSEKSSIKNLEMLGIKYDEIYHNHNYPDITFKIEFKKKISKTNSIILAIGDQMPDIQGLKNCLCIKLPGYNDLNSYFTYDNNNYYII